MPDHLQDQAIFWILGVLFSGMAIMLWQGIKNWMTTVTDSIRETETNRNLTSEKLTAAINKLNELMMSLERNIDRHSFQIEALQTDVRDLRLNRRKSDN